LKMHKANVTLRKRVTSSLNNVIYWHVVPAQHPEKKFAGTRLLLQRTHAGAEWIMRALYGRQCDLLHELGVHHTLLLSLSPSLQEAGQMLRGTAVHECPKLRQWWILRRRLSWRLRQTWSDLYAIAEKLLPLARQVLHGATPLRPPATLFYRWLQKLLRQDLRVWKVWTLWKVRTRWREDAPGQFLIDHRCFFRNQHSAVDCPCQYVEISTSIKISIHVIW
jgi:hypothetical protein